MRTQRDDHPQAEERPQEKPTLSTPHLGLLDARSEKKTLLKPPDLCRFAMAALANYHSLALSRLCPDLWKGFLVSFTVVFICHFCLLLLYSLLLPPEIMQLILRVICISISLHILIII